MTQNSGPADITICEKDYDLDYWTMKDPEIAYYMESGFRFYGSLLRFRGMLLHSSAVEWQGNAYLFSGPSGMGKSTHTRLWQSLYGDAAQVFNDDKPALRCIDGGWFAYGTPWCGKDGINQNKKVPLAGICFLKRGTENRIRRLHSAEAVPLLMGQTHYRFRAAENMERLLALLNDLIRDVPIYEMECLPDLAAAQLSSQTMSGALK